MARIYETTEYSTQPTPIFTLERKPGVPIDLSEALAVKVIIQRDDGDAITNAGHQEAVILSQVGDDIGKVRYTPHSGDWAPAGNYSAEVRITWPEGTEVIPERQPILSYPQLPIS